MNTVLLGQSYYLRFDPKLWEAMQPYPPLGTLYAASHLRSKGFQVALFDAMLAESIEGWAAALDLQQPRFAVIYEDSFNYLSKMCLLRMREAAWEMIEQAKARGCTVIVSGSDATDHRKDYFEKGADYILIGEGEITLADLIASLSGQSPTPAGEIEGVVSSDTSNGSVAARQPLRDLDQLPFPAWDLVDVKKYRELWQSRHGYYSVNMVTTRGCPYHCNWCAKPIYGQRYHSRSPESVIEELKWLRQRQQPDHVWFADDIFGLKRGWIERFSDLVCENQIQTPFKCLLRTDLVSERIAEKLAAAGCRTVWVGAESGSQKILDAMDKGTRLEDTHRATKQLQRVGIKVGFFLQFGYPGEGWSDVQQTLRMVRDCGPDEIGISVSYPLPGTKFHEAVSSQLGAKQNWIDSSDLAMLYQGPFSHTFYRRLHTALHKEHRARGAWQRLAKGDWKALGALGRALTLPWDRVQLYRLRG